MSLSADRAVGLFRAGHGAEPEGVWHAPGRVNLIGEHTDYNFGWVLPFALDRGVVVAAARRGDDVLDIRSMQAEGLAVVPLPGLRPGGVTGWAAYPAGVAWAMRVAGLPVGGASLVIDSDLPQGAGLSSSAAIECAVAIALADLYGADVPRTELALLARRAENEMVGVPSGIMDQSASLLCEAGHALLLDCRSGQTTPVPFDPAAAGLALLVVDTGARHALTDGRYAQRRAECERAARALGVASLRDVTDPARTAAIADPVLARRARHVVSDNCRVLAAADLLGAVKGGGVAGLGGLLHDSHASLRDDFEVSWPQADVAAEAAEQAGALGARMVGGGFGGSVIALVPADAAAVRGALRAAYAARGWAPPTFLDAPPSAGARRILLVLTPPPHPSIPDPATPPKTFWPRASGRGQDTSEERDMAVTEDATAIAGELTQLRRAIHAEPEVGLNLPRTQEKIVAALDGLPLEVTLGSALSSVTAVLHGEKKGNGEAGGGPAVLLRADMDALPVAERTGLGFASRIDGTMHACGHDLHSAMLVGAARLLSARRAELPGSVVFMFQPGEEGHGGAKFMIEEGVLDAAGKRAAAAYALHVASAELPFGVFSTREGPMMAAAEALDITVTGRGGHGSQPHHAADPIPAACEIVTALQVMVTRRFDIFDPVVVTVGSFHAGTTNNVIPDEARLEATIRSFSPESRALVRDSVVHVVHQIAAAHGLTATAEFTGSYPVTINDDAEAQFAAGVVTDFLGEDRYHPQGNPMAGAEDFSYVLEDVPGAFIMLGACPPGVDPATAPFNHSALAVFDDMVLADGAALFAELAVRRLTS